MTDKFLALRATPLKMTREFAEQDYYLALETH
jgi:hypothetical protein